MKLNEVHQGIQKHKKSRRVGRGTRVRPRQDLRSGAQGSASNAGYKASPVFQGGTMPLVRRVPKRGFNNRFALQVATVNVGDLERMFQDGDEVNADVRCGPSPWPRDVTTC
jgi:large subunit ribosomal protein L15